MPAAVFDTTFSSRAALERHLLGHRPDVVGIYTNLMTKLAVLDIIRFIRAQPALAGTRVVLGGPEVTHHAEQFLAARRRRDRDRRGGRDAARAGERLGGRRAAGRGRRHRVSRRGGARSCAPPRGRCCASWTSCRCPSARRWTCSPTWTPGGPRHGKNAISVSTMRGCPYTCRWCSRAVYGESYRRRSPRAGGRRDRGAGRPLPARRARGSSTTSSPSTTAGWRS